MLLEAVLVNANSATVRGSLPTAPDTKEYKVRQIWTLSSAGT
jgi:hypothetical protein